MSTVSFRTIRRGTLCAALLSCAGTAFAQDGFSPDAAMILSPDISESHIAFGYANDLWLVPIEGGTATKIASAAGTEFRPRFSPDNQTIAFVGNYEGNRDIYTVAASGFGNPERVTYHPAGEFLCDWTPDGDLLFHTRLKHDHPKAANLFTVGAAGGLPEQLPVPYGTLGAISPDGKWLAYTPHTRDQRTWNRYRGGMATDIWLFNLETFESRKITDFDGTDTQPMWSADGKTVYYLSDGGDEHRMNVWKYDVASGDHTQVTEFAEYDVRNASIGPGERGRGAIVFQLGPEIRVLDLRSGRSESVDITIPGERKKLRSQVVEASPYLVGGDISATGKRVVAEARGEIWTLPAEDGITRNLTMTDGVAERSPIWSPDGRWIAYLSDATGEYEVYVTQSDGKGETRQLTTNGDTWRQLVNWSPDSEKILFTDKTGALYMLDVESGNETHVATDVSGWPPSSASWSHDSAWITFSLSDPGNGNGVVHIYNVETGEIAAVTSPMFNTSSPVFDRAGEYMYFSSQRTFNAPTFSEVDSTWVYQDTGLLIAVPLNADVESPFELTNDEEEWEEEDESEESTDEGDEAAEGEAEELDPAFEAYDLEHPLWGRWEGEVMGLDNVNIMGQQVFPDASMPYSMVVLVTKEGDVLLQSEFQGETSSPDSAVWDAGAGTLTTSNNEQGIESVTVYTLDGDTLSGEWSLTFPEMLGGGSFSGSTTLERTGDEIDVETLEEVAEEAGDASGGDEDEPVVIDFEGFEARGILLPASPGSFGNLAVNDKNQLLYVSQGGGVPSIKMIDVSDIEDGEKNVLTGAFGFSISGDGKKMVVASFQGFGTANAGSGASVKALDLSNTQMRVDPRDEWRNVVTDAWRRFRDFFYDENMHGVDWDAVGERYIGLVDDAVTREDVSMIIREMISELNVGHAYYNGGSSESEPFVNVGMLGVDFALGADDDGNEAYMFSHFYHGGDWDVEHRNPLLMPGMDIQKGTYLLAVNGLPVDTAVDPWAAFQRTVGETTILTVSDSPVMDEEAREVMVVPHAPGREYELRYRAWIEANRQYVDLKTDGEIGYIYVTNTAIDGHNDLVRQFFGQREKAALIIDERWNGGGFLPHRLIEVLDRPVRNYWALRDGQSWQSPSDGHQGPKAMLINGLAGSGGDMFPALFRQHELGALIGTRTWGGLVGITGMPAMIDGSSVSVPNFAYYEKDGTWGIEGHGVDPDIEVIDDPALMVTGDDPQIDAAIEHLMNELKTKRYIPVPKPAGPDRSGMGITEEDK